MNKNTSLWDIWNQWSCDQMVLKFERSYARMKYDDPQLELDFHNLDENGIRQDIRKLNFEQFTQELQLWMESIRVINKK